MARYFGKFCYFFGLEIFLVERKRAKFDRKHYFDTIFFLVSCHQISFCVITIWFLSTKNCFLYDTKFLSGHFLKCYLMLTYFITRNEKNVTTCQKNYFHATNT